MVNQKFVLVGLFILFLCDLWSVRNSVQASEGDDEEGDQEQEEQEESVAQSELQPVPAASGNTYDYHNATGYGYYNYPNYYGNYNYSYPYGQYYNYNYTYPQYNYSYPYNYNYYPYSPVSQNPSGQPSYTSGWSPTNYGDSYNYYPSVSQAQVAGQYGGWYQAPATGQGQGPEMKPENTSQSNSKKKTKKKKTSNKKVNSSKEEGPVFMGGVMDLKDFAKIGNVDELMSGNLKIENIEPLLNGEVKFEKNLNHNDFKENPDERVIDLRKLFGGKAVVEIEPKDNEEDEETEEEEEEEDGEKPKKSKKTKKSTTPTTTTPRPYPAPYPYHTFYPPPPQPLVPSSPAVPQSRPSLVSKSTNGDEQVYDVNIPPDFIKHSGELLDELGNVRKLSFGGMAKGLARRAVKSTVYRMFPSVRSMKGVAERGCKDVQSIGSLDSVLLPLGLAVTMHPLLMPLVPFLLLTLGTIKAIESATCFVSDFF
ncbi:hypothetical protein HDE_13593 [Halotydeus destructor]|nr:hypothetical protein HDE_13593 [Halotydeus destructor]